jgi:hypothetical protein
VANEREGKLLSRIRGNAEWAAIKWGWTLMTPFLVAFYEKARHLNIDWYLFGYLLALSIFVILAGWAIKSSSKTADVSENGRGSGHREEPPDSLALLFTPIQREILDLVKDLRQLVKDAGPAPTLQTKMPGPMPKGANVQVWTELKKIESDEWMKEYSEWARKVIYSYRQHFAGRVKKFRDALGASTGLVVVSLDTYTTDIRPGEDFYRLRDVLLGFLIELDKMKDGPQPQLSEKVSIKIGTPTQEENKAIAPAQQAQLCIDRCESLNCTISDAYDLDLSGGPHKVAILSFINKYDTSLEYIRAEITFFNSDKTPYTKIEQGIWRGGAKDGTSMEMEKGIPYSLIIAVRIPPEKPFCPGFICDPTPEFREVSLQTGLEVQDVNVRLYFGFWNQQGGAFQDFPIKLTVGDSLQITC